MSTATLPRPTVANAAGGDESEIRDLINQWSRALEKKDLDGLTAHFLPDAVLFDVKPPYKTEGPAAIRQLWQECLPHFPASFKSEHHELRITVGGDVAFVHGLHHMKPLDPPDHPCGQSWVRVTACYRKVNGRWFVAHEHVSFPFDCTTGQISPIVNPA